MADSHRYKAATLLFLLLSISPCLKAVDIFAWLGMPDRPLAIAAPDWAKKGSRLRLEYDTHEYYKRWVDDRLVNDFSGKGSHAELSMQLLPDFAIGARKKFAEPQAWENSMNDKSDRFHMDSKAEAGDVFLRVVRRKFALEIGGGSGKGYFTGEYDLHRDIINALGSNPPLHLNNGETSKYAKFFGTFRRFKLALAINEAKYAHRASASTPALNLVLNHDRKVRQKSAELSWTGYKGFSPYLRYEDYQDDGNGENFKDLRFKFGSNRSEIGVNGLTLGGVYRYKSTRYFAELSRIDFDADLATDFNLITLNPLFLFGTNRVAYRIDYRPDNPWALRLGGQRFYRGIDYFAQYSYASFSGVSTTWSSKDYSMFAKSETDVTVSDASVELHRLALCLSRPDHAGRWQAKLNLLVPVGEINERKEAIPSVPGPPPPPQPAKLKPEESIRGGWQIIIAREFDL